MSETMRRRRADRLKQRSYEEGYDDAASEGHWLTTFGDLVTLLLTFFIILLSISMPDEEKFKEVIGVLQRALIKDVKKTKMEVLADQLDKFIVDENLSSVTRVEHTSRGLKLDIPADFAFEPGSAELTEEQKRFLDGIFPIIEPVNNKIEVNAHTDINPVNRDLFSSNWDLSGARASVMAGYLVGKLGIQGARITSTGNGEFKPRYLPPDDPENMEKNRRVEIEVLSERL